MAQIDRSEGLVGSTAFKAPCRAATTANITLSAEQTIDGVACVADDRVLVKNQTTGADNGIYVVSTGTWERSDDWDGSYDIVCGTFIYVTSGTVNASTNWRVTTSDPIVIGTTSITIAAAFGSLDVPGDIHSASAKTPVVDADELGLVDSAASWVLKKFTLTTLWTWIQTHAGTTYAALAGSASQAFAASTMTANSTVRGNTAAGTDASSAVVGIASTSGFGIYGESDTGFAIRGISNNYAVYGNSMGTGYGVFGFSASGIGVSGISTNNYGLVASSDISSPAKSAFRIVPQDANPTGANEIGDIYVTTAGVLKICTVAGSPGTWVSVGTQT